jgi:hypothetical protein
METSGGLVGRLLRDVSTQVVVSRLGNMSRHRCLRGAERSIRIERSAGFVVVLLVGDVGEDKGSWS